MVGKITRVRQKLHQEAVRLQRPPAGDRGAAAGSGRPGGALAGEPRLQEPPPAPEPRRSGPGPGPGPGEPPQQVQARQGSCDTVQALQGGFPSRIFSGTKILPEVLVQKLIHQEPAEEPPSPRRGPDQRKLKTKRVKLSEKRQIWMKKMTSIRESRVQQAAAARRQATPVVGDLQPLADALPELSQLLGAPGGAQKARRRGRKDRVPERKPPPTDFSQMKRSQKQQLLESECSRFQEAVKTLSCRTDPLVLIGETLRRRMEEEEEGGPR
ncbi:ribosome biogenesis protein SLX9 homolog [Cololabis saira]|uniref:ribosome biogenesis protein SLX9 homolog n=1 Tax=Cololabis saira TaxID=129043 RepID=UPI002AD50D49|nr:ribosome biogenesis protein SLX9 homolog [Cololabis saira]